MPFTGIPPYRDALNAEEGGETVPQDTAWMTHSTPILVPDVSSGPSPVGPHLTGIPAPTLFRADLHLQTSYSTQHQASTLHSGHGQYPM
jgi:hypothetical protein